MTNHLAGLAAVLLAVASGCTAMCQTPYDYCNAVINPNGCPNCNFGARYGSRFAPMFGTPATTPLEPTTASGPAGVEESAPTPSDRQELYNDFESTDAEAVSTDSAVASDGAAPGVISRAGATADKIKSFLSSRSSQASQASASFREPPRNAPR